MKHEEGGGGGGEEEEEEKSKQVHNHSGCISKEEINMGGVD